MSDTACIDSRVLKLVDGPTGLVEEFFGDGTVRVTLQKASRVRPGFSCAGHDQPPTIHHLSDRGLDRAVIAQRRLIEDLERDGRRTTAAQTDLRVLRALQRVRLRLRWRYGARDAYGPESDRGTDAYDHWLRLDEPPSYALAFDIDRQRFDHGKSHIVAWSA